MVDFRIEFVLPTIGSISMIYTYENGLIGLKNSFEKASINNDFVQEPDRVEIEILLDDWLVTNLVNADEVNNGVSSYDIKVFNGTTLGFRGAVLLEGLGYGYPEEVLKIKAYSYSYLIGLEDGYSYFPANRSLTAIMDGIKQRIASHYDRTLNFISEAVSYKERNEVDFPFYTLPSQYNVDERVTDLGFDSYSLPFHNDAFIIRFRRIDWEIYDLHNRYYLTASIYTCEISNKICVDMDRQYDKIGDYATLSEAQSAITSAKLDYPEHYDSTYWINRLEYSFLEIYGTTYKVASDQKTLTITGNIYPSELVLKDDNKQYLTALKCFLIIHNLTIIKRESDGLLQIVNNNWGSVYHGDLTSDITSCEVYRDFKQLLPDFSCLDSLYTNADTLKAILTEDYTVVSANVVKYKLKLDDISKHDLSLFERITVNAVELFMVELKRDYIIDEYQLVCWRV